MEGLVNILVEWVLGIRVKADSESWKFGGGSFTLSATIGPLVALVSAAMTTPPSNIQPTIVVPVLVAFGRGTPRAWREALRLKLEKSKPGIAADRNHSV